MVCVSYVVGGMHLGSGAVPLLPATNRQCLFGYIITHLSLIPLFVSRFGG
jgi:hypothetical protein